MSPPRLLSKHQAAGLADAPKIAPARQLDAIEHRLFNDFFDCTFERRTLYRRLRELWGVSALQKAFSSHKNMIQRCQGGYASLDQRLRDKPTFLFYLGPPKGRDETIDRIDPNRGYEVGNIRWAGKLTQSRNRRCTRYMTVGDRTATIMEWSEERRISPQRLYRGLDAGKSGADILQQIGLSYESSADRIDVPKRWIWSNKISPQEFLQNVISAAKGPVKGIDAMVFKLKELMT